VTAPATNRHDRFNFYFDRWSQFGHITQEIDSVEVKVVAIERMPTGLRGKARARGHQREIDTRELPLMEISARNQLTGTVQSVKSGSVMAEISVNVDAGQITAAITDSSRERLGLKDGDQVSVIIKATEVMIATP
jgi:molybdopterin-binding protein